MPAATVALRGTGTENAMIVPRNTMSNKLDKRKI